MGGDKQTGKFEIVFYDNSDLKHDLLPQTRIALFAKVVDPVPPNVDVRRHAVYSSPYLILSGMIVKDILAKKNVRALIGAFYNYLKPTRYDLLLLDRTRVLHTFNSVEEFFYDIIYPDDKSKTRPLEPTPLRDPHFLSDTVSNTQFIRQHPAEGAPSLSEQMARTNLDVGIQFFHFEKIYTTYDKLNNIIIPEEKAIKAVRDDVEMKRHILKVDLKKYTLSALDEVAYQQGKIYSLRGHYLVGHTFYNSRDVASSTYLIVERPQVVNTLALCADNTRMNSLVNRFISQRRPVTNDREIVNLVNPQLQAGEVMEFLVEQTGLLTPFLNKDYILLDKDCVRPEQGVLRILQPRKFIANMYEAKYFLELSRQS